jgi:dsRNA-specific ribonuclease
VSIGLYRTLTKYKPGDLTRHRSALTCNDCFGVLAVKFGIHKFLLGLPPSLLHNANKFAENQEEASHLYSNIVKKKPFKFL